MKTKYTPAIIIFCAVCLTAFRLIDDVVSQLGMQHHYIQRSILNNIIGRQNHSAIDESLQEDSGGNTETAYNQLKSFAIPYAKMLSTVVEGDKITATKEMCQYVKNYVHSQKFLTDYEQARKSAMPTEEPPAMDPNMITMLKQAVKDQEKELIKIKASKQVPADMIKKMEEGISDQKKMIALSNDPTPNKTKWQKLYPENPEVLIKARLEEYLKLASTVDFNAAVTANGRKKTFSNPAYEKKSLKWKAIYRAGKDVNTSTTVFAKEWMQQGVKMASVISVPSDDNTAEKAKVSEQSPSTTESETEKFTPAKGLKSLKEKAKKVLN
jgi:hypothetical protein